MKSFIAAAVLILVPLAGPCAPQKAKPQPKKEAARHERERLRRAQIKRLVDQYTATLPTGIGATHWDEEKQTMLSCVDVHYTFTTRWLNSSKTKALITVTQHANWTGAVSGRPYLVRQMDYDAGGFTCEADSGGAWQITNQ